MASRRRAREFALQMLFQWDIGKDAPEKVQAVFWGSRGRGLEEPPAPPPRPRKRSKKKPEPPPPPVPEPPPPELSPEEQSLRAFANELFSGTVESLDEIDSMIRRHAEHWRLERMAVVDRNILRLAIYEMLHRRETPPAVVINEALEIARKFSEEASVAFLNGLLDRIRKEKESATNSACQASP